MSEMSDFLENALINHTLRNISLTSPTDVYLALFTSDPGDSGSGTEVSGSGYAREIATFAPPVGGSASINANVVFTASGGSWGTITHIGIYDALTGGNLLYHSPLDTPRTVDDGDTLTFSSGTGLTVTLD